MFSKIRDPIGRVLLLVFLTKPLVDLTFFLSTSLGGIKIAPTHVYALVLFGVLVRYRFQLGAHGPPFLRLLDTFIALHFLALLLGVALNDRFRPSGVLDFMLRLLDSYLIYVAAFLAATRYRYRDITPFIQAIVIGSSVAVFLNVPAVFFGIGHGFWQSKAQSGLDALRSAGLYYDPGVLGNVAFFNLMFAVFLMHLAPARGRLRIGLAVVLILADLYLIAASKSRASMIQLAMFGAVYLWFFQRAWGKIVAPIGAVIVLGAAMLVFDINVEELFVRFDSDVAALESGEAEEVGISESGEVSLGKFEGLGNNRLMIWAQALTNIYNRSAPEILFGNFSGSISHSDYIDIVGRSGVISLVVYLAFMLAITTYSWRRARTARPGHDRTLYFMAFTLLVCYLFYSLPFRPLSYTTSSWYMWTVLGFMMARAKLSSMGVDDGLSLRVRHERRPRRDLLWDPTRLPAKPPGATREAITRRNEPGATPGRTPTRR